METFIVILVSCVKRAIMPTNVVCVMYTYMYVVNYAIITHISFSFVLITSWLGYICV